MGACRGGGSLLTDDRALFWTIYGLLFCVHPEIITIHTKEIRKILKRVIEISLYCLFYKFLNFNLDIELLRSLFI